MRRTGGHVLDWMYFNYAAAAIAMTLRWNAQQETTNLRHLLHEMEEQPQVTTSADCIVSNTREDNDGALDRFRAYSKGYSTLDAMIFRSQRRRSASGRMTYRATKTSDAPPNGREACLRQRPKLRVRHASDVD